MSLKKQMSQTQKNTLLELMEENPQLITQKVSNQYTNQDIKKKWIEISEKLNSIPGTNRSWKDWRKCWSDIKSRIKKKAKEMRSMCQTGGGGPDEDNRTDEILDMLGGDVLISGLDIPELGLPVQAPASPEEPAHVLLPEHSMESGNANDISKKNQEENSNKNYYSMINTKKSTRVRPPVKTKKKVIGNASENVTTLKRKNNLTTSIDTSHKFIKLGEEKYELKKQYYERKIQILEQQSKTLERIAVGIENCVEQLLIKKID
ncbi:unnamed protein product [Ceutorhynchus assimilis]|uniref:Regulatory protein zeste n=1 Tax=Ceutorhynchus assimilis TaxID=467358 RepID=A0A9N9MIC5_9CUCU|nr:unnamed protein product [Ceutorhynchus assimilis]